MAGEINFGILPPIAGYADVLAGQQGAQQQQARQLQLQTAQRDAQLKASQIAARQKAAGQLGAGDRAGATTTALGAGDFDLLSHIQTLSKAEKEQALERSGAIASQAQSLLKVPADQRPQALAAIIPALKQHGLSDQDIANVNLTDQGLAGYVNDALGVKGAVEQSNKDRDYDLDLSKFGYQQQNDTANRGVQMRGQDITVRGQNMSDARSQQSIGIARANLGLRAQEVAQQGVGGLSPKQAFQTAIQTRKEFDGLQDVKNYKAAIPIIASAAKAPNTAAGDVDLVYSVGKLFDPTSVVREGEMKLALGSGSMVERIVGQSNVALSGGARLSPQIRQRLLETLKNRTAAYAGAYNQARQNYAQLAQDIGVDPTKIVGTHPGDQLVKAGLAKRSGGTQERQGGQKVISWQDLK